MGINVNKGLKNSIVDRIIDCKPAGLYKTTSDLAYFTVKLIAENHLRCYNAFQNSINMNTSLIFDVTQNKLSGEQLIIQDDTASKAAPNHWIVTHA